MQNKLVTVVLAAAIIALGAYTFTHQTAPLPTQQVGAVSSPDISSPYLAWGGVREWRGSAAFNASSTLCAIQGPAATSTLQFANMAFTSQPAYTTSYMIGYSATKNATTTGLTALTAEAAGELSPIVATTSVTVLKDGIVAPNAWINFNLSTSTATGLNQAIGRCSAGFREI